MRYQVKVWDRYGERVSDLDCDDDAEAIEALPLYHPSGRFRLELWQDERPVLVSGET